MSAATLFDFDGHWHQVKRSDVRARLLADGHYSRQTPGSVDFMSSGRTFVLITLDALAVWGVIENMDPAGGHRWRCTIFRNERPVHQGGVLSSDLIREATTRTHVYWRRHYGGLPSVGLTTEVDPRKTRHKRDPGRCFVKAGWTRRHGITRHGHVVLDAPEETP